jgi:hypothetical protein
LRNPFHRHRGTNPDLVILAVLAMHPGMAPRFSLDDGATLNMGWITVTVY